ncbi:MAG TPA: vitamin K epoxide reductase family protein [Ktedonobacteraceae bacterium]|nr:vitamin K epoxide reductase family protein [Ktedonobacteraceae bacterium]
MRRLRRSGKGSQLLLLVLSLLGVGITIYLTSVHYENVPLVCSESGLVNCARVISSSYSVVPGTTVPRTIPGFGWCVVSASLATVGMFATTGLWQRRIHVAQFVWTMPGLLVVLYLVYAEIVRLHTICAWCTALHILILLMFLITLVQLQSVPSESTFRSEETSEDAENVSAFPGSK